MQSIAASWLIIVLGEDRVAERLIEATIAPMESPAVPFVSDCYTSIVVILQSQSFVAPGASHSVWHWRMLGSFQTMTRIESHSERLATYVPNRRAPPGARIATGFGMHPHPARLQVRFSATPTQLSPKPDFATMPLESRHGLLVGDATLEPYTVRMRVGLDDVDHVQVLYYPRVAHLACLALEDFFRHRLGLPWPQMLDEHNVAMPTVDLHITYRRPLRYGEEFDVTVAVKELSRRTVVFAMEIRKTETGDLVNTIMHTAVFVSRVTWEAIAVPEQYRAALTRNLVEAR